ncbi:MAG: ABC transporter ATP-binding protein [Chloroflexi bacterium]|nr:ABC transporter ATP-binding protein [Chloroflexota bacterium]
MNAVLSAENLSVGYARRTVLADITAALLPGELVCLIGANGVGKSTLLRTLAGMQPPLAGRALLLGDEVQRLDLRARAKRLSLVLTERVDAGMMTAYALVALGRYPHTDWSGRLSAHDDAVVRRALAAVGASDFAQRNIDELSDGERQKVFIARALAQEPAVILLDEPTAWLDVPRRAEIMRVLRVLAHESGRAVLLSTHDLDLALRSADRLWLLAHDGRLHVGAPEDLVLNGALAAAFVTEGLEFDVHSGAFRLSKTHLLPVHLAGHGLRALWTARALERAGFRASGEPCPLTIDVLEDGRWRLTSGQQSARYSTLYDLLMALRKSLP